MNGGWQIKGDDDKQQLAIVDVARQAAEMAGCAHKAKSDVDEITRVLANDDHVEMWQTLQKFIVRYTYFIIGISPFTGIIVYRLTPEMIRIVTTEAIRYQLKLMIGYVYAYYALNGTSRIAFQNHFKRLSEKSHLGR